MLLTRQVTRGGRFGAARPVPWLGDPLHLTAQAFVPPGGGASVNVNAFRPPTTGGYIISAIKFQIQPSVAGAITKALNVPGFVFGQGFSLGAAITAAFSLIQYNASAAQPATPGTEKSIGAFAGRIPIAALCDSRDASSDLLSGGFASAGAGAAFNLVHPISEYRWDLPEPFYVPAGWVFVPQLFGLGGNASGNVGVFGGALTPIPELQVQVSYEGTLLDPDRYDDDGSYLDDVIRVPFACGWIAPAQPPTTTPPTLYSATSDETNLVNIYDSPAAITRMNGKVIASPQFVDLGDVGPDVQIRMLFGNSVPLVRDRSEFREVFDRQTRGWSIASDNAPFMLDPGEFVIVNLAGSIPFSFTPAGNGSFQPMIAFTGYRELKRGNFE